MRKLHVVPECVSTTYEPSIAERGLIAVVQLYYLLWYLYDTPPYGLVIPRHGTRFYYEQKLGAVFATKGYEATGLRFSHNLRHWPIAHKRDPIDVSNDELVPIKWWEIPIYRLSPAKFKPSP